MKKLKLAKDFDKKIEEFVDNYVNIPEGWTRKEAIIWASNIALTFVKCPHKVIPLYIK